jgi:thioredoxin reductase (NADPH)
MPLLTSRNFKKGTRVIVAGGANSAGQCILKLCSMGAEVIVVSRSPLEKSMSQYLIDRIRAQETIKVLEGAKVTAVEGRGRLSHVLINHEDRDFGIQASMLVIMIGAIPHTAWLLGTVTLNSKKFIMTDVDLHCKTREILPGETSIPGVFAAGDVRGGQAVKRITGAVGDGISALQSCHRFCSTNGV